MKTRDQMRARLPHDAMKVLRRAKREMAKISRRANWLEQWSDTMKQFHSEVCETVGRAEARFRL